MGINSYYYDNQEGYYGSKEDYYDSEGHCYNAVCVYDVSKNDEKVLKNDNKFKISTERREELRQEIKRYFAEERGEALGEVACNMLLDFFIEKIAPEVYNQGIEDAYKYIIEKLESLLEIKK